MMLNFCPVNQSGGRQSTTAIVALQQNCTMTQDHFVWSLPQLSIVPSVESKMANYQIHFQAKGLRTGKKTGTLLSRTLHISWPEHSFMQGRPGRYAFS